MGTTIGAREGSRSEPLVIDALFFWLLVEAIGLIGLPFSAVLFASVYRHFRDIGEFMNELKDLLNPKD